MKVFITLLGVYAFLMHIKGDLFSGADMPIKFIFILYAIFVLFNKSPKASDDAGEHVENSLNS